MQDVYTKESDLTKTINQGEQELKKTACDAPKQLQQFINQADHQLRENPWPVLAGVAVACLFLGFFAGNVRSRN